MRRLRELFVAGKKDQVEAEAKKMAADPKHRFVNFEGKINESVYNLLNAKRLEDALFIFPLNTKLYPGSANTWDSLGEAYWKSNNVEKAIEYYTKAIEMDPNGATGENARQVVKRIRGERPQ